MQTQAIRRRYEQALEWVVIALMAALALEVIAGVVFRTAGHSLAWYDEVASILLAWLTFYGSALASAKRAHIGCPELVALLPPVPRVLARLLVEIIVIAFFLLVGWTGYTVLGVLDTDHLVSLPAISVAWVQSVVPISAALIIVAELLNLPGVLADAGGANAITGGASQ
jgi:TRAP-type C4-dicarboxylate transport system permease small subunit